MKIDKTVLTIAFLVFALLAAIIYAGYAFGQLNVPFPTGHALIAFVLGAVGSLIVSIGLFGLLFWSARTGRDDIDLNDHNDFDRE